jgi:hypothetical protein
MLELDEYVWAKGRSRINCCVKFCISKLEIEVGTAVMMQCDREIKGFLSI